MNGLKKDLEEQIDNMEQYFRRQCLLFMGIEEEREENTDQVILEFCKNNVSVNSKPDHAPRAKPPGNFFDRRIPHPPGKKEFKTPTPRAYKNDLKPHPGGIFLNYSQ